MASCSPYAQTDFLQKEIHGNRIRVDDRYPGSVDYPPDFKIWVGDRFVVNAPASRTKSTLLPTNNDNRERPSCYVACYSHHAQHSVYGGKKFFGDNIFVMSQVSVLGRYVRNGQKSICLPTGFENVDISKERFFNRLCEQKFPKACAGSRCWAGGETDWFGVGR